MKEKLSGLFQLQSAIRSFFQEYQFLDVLTPPVVENPGEEVHLHPFALFSTVSGKRPPKRYLHTSPEFRMKELLSLGFEKIFTLGYAFRDEPHSNLHRFQFLLLEWYRVGESECRIMEDCRELIEHSANQLAQKGYAIAPPYRNVTLKKMSVDQLFRDVLNISILDYLDRDDLKNLIAHNYPDISPPSTEDLLWEDYYFLLFLNKIEPLLRDWPALVLDEFPHPLAALAKPKPEDQRVCQRFEIYLRGVELCNCYNELTDLEAHRRRFAGQRRDKFRLYHYRLPPPERLYRALEQGLPPCAGVALGVERLYAALTGIENPFWD